MNDQFTRQAQEIFSAAKDARIPENIQAFAEDSVGENLNWAARESGDADLLKDTESLGL